MPGRAGGIKEARAAATLDKQIGLSPETARELGASGTVVSRREFIQRARAVGATLKEVSVRREAAERKLREEIERANRGWSIPIGNPHHPDTIKHNEKIARLKAGIFEVEYRLFLPSETFFVITKTEADYFTSLTGSGAVAGRKRIAKGGMRSMSNVRGKPCPICGSKDTVTERWSEGGKVHCGVTACNACGAS